MTKECECAAHSAADCVCGAWDKPEQKLVEFPNRYIVEREIEKSANPTGMRLNDGKERVTLPCGTLRFMLNLIDRTATPQRKPLTHEQRLDLLTKFESRNKWDAHSILIDMVEAAHGIKEKNT